MNNVFMRCWWVLALRGVLGILFGVLALLWPGLTLLTLIALFAVYALLGGIASIVGAVRNRRHGDDWGLLLLIGLVGVGARVRASVHPHLTALGLVRVLAGNA